MNRGTPRVAVCCDLAPETGTTHVVRCLALAEELASRGVEIVFVCDADSVPWAQAQITARGMAVVAPVATAGQHVDLLEVVAADAVVFDSRLLPRAVFAAVRRTGRPTLAIVDGDVVEVEADILVAPSMGAEAGRLRAPQEASVLAGLDYALLRNDVLANRPIASPRHDTVEVPRVLGVFGDHSIDTAASLASVLAECDRPIEATFVHADARVRAGVEAVQPASGQRFEVVEPDLRVVERVVRADVVLSDAGTSAWELLCLGAATGLVWSAEDQVEAYRGLMVQRVVIGLGSVEGLRDDPAPGVEKMTRLLGDARERTRLADAGWRLVDGMGRARVADALLALL